MVWIEMTHLNWLGQVDFTVDGVKLGSVNLMVLNLLSGNEWHFSTMS